MNTMAMAAINRNQPKPSENAIPMLESPNHISSMITQISSVNVIINSPYFTSLTIHNDATGRCAGCDDKTIGAARNKRSHFIKGAVSKRDGPFQHK